MIKIKIEKKERSNFSQKSSHLFIKFFILKDKYLRTVSKLVQLWNCLKVIKIIDFNMMIVCNLSLILDMIKIKKISYRIIFIIIILFSELKTFQRPQGLVHVDWQGCCKTPIVNRTLGIDESVNRVNCKWLYFVLGNERTLAKVWLEDGPGNWNHWQTSYRMSEEVIDSFSNLVSPWETFWPTLNLGATSLSFFMLL